MITRQVQTRLCSKGTIALFALLLAVGLSPATLDGAGVPRRLPPMESWRTNVSYGKPEFKREKIDGVD